ncbi:MAG: hypothetical protein J6B89_01140 [Bacilli bacterium]|nr:hypothetical protein [Bacilli bacterium]
MNKELIELQRGCNAVCVVILEDQIKELKNALIMDAKITDEYLFARPTGNPIFKEKLEKMSKNNNLSYFVINQITEISEELQNRYIGLIKDREFIGYNIPNNIILVLTVKTNKDLKKISKDLYHFCVVAI